MNSLIISLVLIGGIALPFLLMSRQRNKKAKQLRQALEQFTSSEGITIDQYDLAGHFAIGIDKTQQLVCFVRELDKQQAEMEAVDLKKVRSCKAVKTKRVIDAAGGNHSVIDRLELSFEPTDRSLTAQQWCFYDIYENAQLADELQLLNKWADLCEEFTVVGVH